MCACRIQVTYGKVLGESHCNTKRDERFTAFDLSDNEYISRIHWGVCDEDNGPCNGCICHFLMETNKGRSVGPLGRGGVKEFQEFHGHRLLYINSTSAYVSGWLVVTSMTMQFGIPLSIETESPLLR